MIKTKVENNFGRFLMLALFMGFLSACGSVSQPESEEFSPELETQAQVLDLWTSSAADRSAPKALDATQVAGEIYTFVESRGVSEVAYHLNDSSRARAPHETEYQAPFDLGGSRADGRAQGFDTRALKDGVNTLTALIRYENGARKAVTATFVVANSAEGFDKALLVSRSSRRLDAAPLVGQNVDGKVHMFLVPKQAVQQVAFFMDDEPVTVERYPFFDLGSTALDGSSRPFDTATLANGKHELRAIITHLSGNRDEVTATFTVGKAAKPDAPAPTDPEPKPEPEDPEPESPEPENPDPKPTDPKHTDPKPTDPKPEPTTPVPSALEPLKVSDNGRYLKTASGQPLFILADTMWGLATLTESEADFYFKTRKEQGFNTILGPVGWGSHFKTPAGNDMDKHKRDENAYYRHLDMLVAKAKKHGLYLGFVVQWGSADRMKKFASPQEAYDYGRFIGNRYRGEPHLFWFGAGEYSLAPKYAKYHEAVSRGVKDAVGSRQLVTVHPAGGEGYDQQSSSDFFHDADWLDFNSVQTWTHDASTFKKIADDWDLSPTKPVFMSETKYEGEGSDAFRMRRLAYWSTFSGSLGFGYGHGDIWSGKRDGKDWRGALQAPGANDMRHLANLIESRSATPSGSVIYFDRRPDDSVIVRVDGGSNSDKASERGHAAAMRDRNGKYLMVYVPTDDASRSVEVDMSKIAGSQAKVWWYSPSSGDAREVGVYDAASSRTFPTPRGADDWVLVVEDASYRWGAPGQ
ncbi:hypothetical protein BH24DEI2_BH24DEI2_19310 [soil metagenome]